MSGLHYDCPYCGSSHGACESAKQAGFIACCPECSHDSGKYCVVAACQSTGAFGVGICPGIALHHLLGFPGLGEIHFFEVKQPRFRVARSIFSGWICEGGELMDVRAADFHCMQVQLAAIRPTASATCPTECGPVAEAAPGPAFGCSSLLV